VSREAFSLVPAGGPCWAGWRVAERLRLPIAHLVEVAVRDLSPGIKDPRTAVSVLSLLGSAPAWLSLRHLDSDVRLRDGLVRLRMRPLGYGEVVGVMFDMIHLLIEKATSHRL